MLGHIKSFIAVAISLIVVVAAAIWLRDRSATLESVQKERDSLYLQLDEVRQAQRVIDELSRKKAVLGASSKELTSRLVTTGSEGPQLVGLVVKAASNAGLKVTGTSELTSKDGADNIIKGKNVSLVKTAYKFCLNGSYSGLVKFFHNMSQWEVQTSVDYFQLSGADEKANGDVIGELVISVYSVAKE